MRDLQNEFEHAAGLVLHHSRLSCLSESVLSLPSATLRVLLPLGLLCSKQKSTPYYNFTKTKQRPRTFTSLCAPRMLQTAIRSLLELLWRPLLPSENVMSQSWGYGLNKTSSTALFFNLVEKTGPSLILAVPT